MTAARPRIGVLGLGMASRPHLESLAALQDRVAVAAIFSPTPARCRAAHDTYGFPVTDSAGAIFDEPSIDAVVILTPPNTHLELVERAASRGKHVLLEKPLEIDTARAERLVSVMENAGLTLAIVLQRRFRAVAVGLKAIMKDGRLGELVGCAARLYNWRPQAYYDQPGRGTRARDGGGVLLTQGIHTLDLLISVTGLPREVSGYAATSPIHTMETEDIATAALRFSNGALGSITATTCAYPGFADAIDIIGTKGMARLDGVRLTAHFHGGTTLDLTDDDAGGGAGADPMAFSSMHHRAVLADFLDAIFAGRPPRVTGRAALQAHHLIDAILASSATGMHCRIGAEG